MKKTLKQKGIEWVLFFTLFTIFVNINLYIGEKMKKEIHKYSDILDDNLKHRELIDIINNKCNYE